MHRISIKGIGLAAFAAIGLLTLGLQPSQARTTDQGGVRTQMIDSGDRLDSKQAEATTIPVIGQSALMITETLNYVNEPFWGWKHYTAYTIKRTVTAPFVGRLGYFVLHDQEGDWYAFKPGSVVAEKLRQKPDAMLGPQAQPIDANDQHSLASVTAGNVVVGTPQLNATYNYTHVEALDDVQYSVTSPVVTTFVAEQNAWFAWIGTALYEIDASGKVSQLNDKPTVDRGTVGSVMAASDNTATYPDVIASGGTFLVTWHHVHEETYLHVRYDTQEQVRSDYVPEVNLYMAWIDGVEYQADPGSRTVYRLSQRPVVNLGGLRNPMVNDRPARTEVFNVSSTTVVVRYYFVRNEAYVSKQYYVERVGTMYYNQTWSVWMVAIDGQSYVVGWAGDRSFDPSVPVLQAPAGSTRPQYSVPSTSGDGLPPAQVPGKDNGSGTASPQAPTGGIPGRAAPPRNCVPGRC